MIVSRTHTRTRARIHVSMAVAKVKQTYWRFSLFCSWLVSKWGPCRISSEHRDNTLTQHRTTFPESERDSNSSRKREAKRKKCIRKRILCHRMAAHTPTTTTTEATSLHHIVCRNISSTWARTTGIQPRCICTSHTQGSERIHSLRCFFLCWAATAAALDLLVFGWSTRMGCCNLWYLVGDGTIHKHKYSFYT